MPRSDDIVTLSKSVCHTSVMFLKVRTTKSFRSWISIGRLQISSEATKVNGKKKRQRA